MSNLEARKYLNSLPRYVKNYTNYEVWKNGLAQICGIMAVRE